jgi:hypothetical protein
MIRRCSNCQECRCARAVVVRPIPVRLRRVRNWHLDQPCKRFANGRLHTIGATGCQPQFRRGEQIKTCDCALAKDLLVCRIDFSLIALNLPGVEEGHVLRSR